MQQIMHPVQPIRLRAGKASKPSWGALGNTAVPRAVPRERDMPDHIQVRGLVHEAVLEGDMPDHIQVHGVVHEGLPERGKPEH